MADCWPWEKHLFEDPAGRYAPEHDAEKPRGPTPAREPVGLTD